MKKITFLTLLIFCSFLLYPNKIFALTESEWNNRYQVVTTEPIEFGDGIFYYAAWKFDKNHNQKLDIVSYNYLANEFNVIKQLSNKPYSQWQDVEMFVFNNNLYIYNDDLGKKFKKIYRINSSGKVKTQRLRTNATHGGYITNLGQFYNYYYLAISTYKKNGSSSNNEYKRSYIYRTSNVGKGNKWERIFETKNKGLTHANKSSYYFFIKADSNNKNDGYYSYDGVNFYYLQRYRRVFSNLKNFINFNNYTLVRKGSYLYDYTWYWRKILNKKVDKMINPVTCDDVLLTKTQQDLELLLSKNGTYYYVANFSDADKDGKYWRFNNIKQYGDAVGVEVYIYNNETDDMHSDTQVFLTKDGDNWHRVDWESPMGRLIVDGDYIVYPNTFKLITSYPKVEPKLTVLRGL